MGIDKSMPILYYSNMTEIVIGIFIIAIVAIVGLLIKDMVDYPYGD